MVTGLHPVVHHPMATAARSPSTGSWKFGLELLVSNGRINVGLRLVRRRGGGVCVRGGMGGASVCAYVCG